MLTSPPPARLFLSVWLADVAPVAGVPPAKIWARGFRAVLVSPSPPPSGVGWLLGQAVGEPANSSWSLWSEHANHKILADSLPPLPDPLRSGSSAAHSDTGGDRRAVRIQAGAGERAALQLGFRLPVGMWGRWRWSGWFQVTRGEQGVKPVAPGTEPVLAIHQVGFVNVSGATAPYGRVGMVPDPLTALELASDEVCTQLRETMPG